MTAMDAVDDGNRTRGERLSGDPQVDLIFAALTTWITDSGSLRRTRLTEALKNTMPVLARASAPLAAKVQAILAAYSQLDSARATRDAAKIEPAVQALRELSKNGALTVLRQAVERLARGGMRVAGEFAQLRREEWERRLADQLRAGYVEAGHSNAKAFLESVRQPAYAALVTPLAERSFASLTHSGETQKKEAAQRVAIFEKSVKPLFHSCSLWSALQGSEPSSKYLETCKPLLCPGALPENGSKFQCQWFADSAAAENRLRRRYVERGNLCSPDGSGAFLRRAIDVFLSR
jgi:hypothetical protein